MVRSLNKHKLRHRQSERRGDSTNPTATTIVRASSPRDFNAARSILARQREWLEGLLGGDLATYQPSALREMAELERFYEPPNGWLLVAMVGGEPAGIVGVHRRGPGVGELKRMYVAPEARGLGIGRALAEGAIEAACELGLDVLRLETHAGHMPVAVKIYRKLGFREIESYSDSFVAFDGLLTMELRLSGRRRAKSTGDDVVAAEEGRSRCNRSNNALLRNSA